MSIISRKNIKVESRQMLIYTVAQENLTFNPTAVKKLNLKPGMRLMFTNDNEWCFFLTEDKDGFELIQNTANIGTLKIYSRGLIRMLQKSTNKQRYKIFDTKIQSNGSTIYQLIPGDYVK